MTKMSGKVITEQWQRSGLTRLQVAEQLGGAGKLPGFDKYKSGEIKPRTPEIAQALDDALGAGGAIMKACGFTPPADWSAEISELRELVDSLRQTISEMNTTIEDLARQVRRRKRPPSAPRAESQ